MSLFCPRNWLNPNIKNRAGQWLGKCREADWKSRQVLFALRRPWVCKENREDA